jgi:hypothetical protein
MCIHQVSRIYRLLQDSELYRLAIASRGLNENDRSIFEISTAILKPSDYCSKTFPCLKADDEQRRLIGSGYDGCLFRQESQLDEEA